MEPIGVSWPTIRDARADEGMEALPLGPALDIADDPADREVPSAIDLDDLGSHSEPLHSIPHLIAEKRASRDADRFVRQVLALVTVDTQTLVVRIASTTDPLMLWSIHVALEKRGVQPCLRWPANTATDQAIFVTWLADLAWVQKRMLDHVPRSKNGIRLFRQDVGTTTWHSSAFWMFKNTYGKRSLARATARALGLTLQQRQELMLCSTSAMVGKRRELHSSTFAETRQTLYDHARAHPDKSGNTTPEAVAARRARLWRVYLLSGKSPTVTASNWRLLTGEAMSRQAISKQIAAIEIALSDRYDAHNS